MSMTTSEKPCGWQLAIKKKHNTKKKATQLYIAALTGELIQISSLADKVHLNSCTI